MKENFIWTEKHRPDNFGEYVFKDDRQRKLFTGWIKDKNIPHLLLHGPAGSGKSTAAGILIKGLGVDPGDLLYVNASEDRNVDMVRTKILNFVQTIGFGDFKVVLLEEAEQVNQIAQPMLKRIMEDYSMAVRFIMTSNHPNKIIAPLRSRCTEVKCDTLDQEEFQLRAAQILVEEGIEFEIDDLDSYIRAAYPDMRKTINLLQEGSEEGRLLPINSDSGTSDWHLSAVELFKQGKIRDGRKMVCDHITDNEYENFYRFCYMNTDLWGKSTVQQDRALHAIRKGMVDHSVAADPEICLADTLTYLAEIYDDQ